MPKVIVPVGFSVGPRYDTGDPEMRYFEISLGEGSVELDGSDLMVMGAVAGDPERHSRHEVTKSSVIELLKNSEPGISDPEPVIDHLLQMGLLLEFDPIDGTSEELEQVLSRHRLFPLAEGLGAT